jgi:hypothetical protein
MAGHRSDCGWAARILRLVVDYLRPLGHDRRHDRGRPAQLRGCEPQGFVPFALPEQLSPGRVIPGEKRSERIKIQVDVPFRFNGQSMRRGVAA